VLQVRYASKDLPSVPYQRLQRLTAPTMRSSSLSNKRWGTLGRQLTFVTQASSAAICAENAAPCHDQAWAPPAVRVADTCPPVVAALCSTGDSESHLKQTEGTMCYEQRLFRSWFGKKARKGARQADVTEQNPPLESSVRFARFTKTPHQSEPWSEQKRQKPHEPEEVI
jgi:hypothetical protein